MSFRFFVKNVMRRDAKLCLVVYLMATGVPLVYGLFFPGLRTIVAVLCALAFALWVLCMSELVIKDIEQFESSHPEESAT